jgi:hypothetical protein
LRHFASPKFWTCYRSLQQPIQQLAGELRVKACLAVRDPVVDRLLPNAAGGTRFFEDLDGNAGMAFAAVPAVGC